MPDLSQTFSQIASMSAGKYNWRSLLIKASLGIVVVIGLGYLIARTYRGGNDINVYLHAAQQLLDRQNIYTQNPYNFYLYSPLFALTLSPLTLLEMPIARVIWMLINVGFTVRLWFLFRAMIENLSPVKRRRWSFFVILLSLGFLNHTLMLGQVTILILWLTLEGCYQMERGRSLLGAALIALGINIKIIPMLALVYFGMRGHFKGIVFTLLFFGLSLILPALFVGFRYNTELLSGWKNAINPSGERFVFEDNDGCQSLNAVLPAYFYDFNSAERSIVPYERDVHYPRTIVALPHDTLALILQLCRILLLVLFCLAVLPRSWIAGPMRSVLSRLRNALISDFSKNKNLGISFPPQFYWEMGCLCLITLLIFPHQMKYSMLYFVPAGAYLIMCMMPGSQIRVTSVGKLLLILAGLLMIVLAIMGRDIIGTHLVDVLDYYHFMGIANLLCLGVMWYVRPETRISGK